MLKHHVIEGLIAAPFTPFKQDYTLNLTMIEGEAERLIRNGVNGAFVCGTTGEGASLSVRERKWIAEKWCALCPQGFKVFVHVGHNSLEAAKELARHARKNGAWAIAACAPSFFKPSSIQELMTICHDIADSAPDLHFYYYHFPLLTGVDFSPVEFVRLARESIPNFAGIKFTDANIATFRCLLNVSEGHLNILFGRDEILHSGLVFGATAAVGSSYNAFAPLFSKLILAFKNHDQQQALFFTDIAIAMFDIYGCGKWPPLAAKKAVMKMIGKDFGPVRLPIRALSRNEEIELEKQLYETGAMDYLSQ